MSVQFGRWNFEGPAPAAEYIDKVNATLAPYGPDSNESYSKDGVKILYRSFCTTKESHRETQPHVFASGAVLTWDGRLDNGAELIGELHDGVTLNPTDVEIVAAAFQRWGDKCLGKLIGDWALSMWNPRERCVLLAKDPIGTEHLYYSFDDKQLTWSTVLDPLVLFAGKTFEICEEYIAGWFAILFPAAHLTPYVGIDAVPPSSFVLLRPAKRVVRRYWDFDPANRIRYRTDAEYEEHFRTVFAMAVLRRLRSDRPVLAELSGGMDSSSIVCVADLLLARGDADCSRLDTISWFDDSHDNIEPDSNELHWITKVEQRRRRTGFHINLRELEPKEVGPQKYFESEFDNDRFAATPIPNRCLSEYLKQYALYIRSQGHRVTFSGIGGEITGDGVPTPTPELQNLLARARFFTLTRQLNAWAAKMRKPRLPLLWEAVRGFFSAPADMPKNMRPAPWLDPGFFLRNRAAFSGYLSRVKLFGPLASFQDNVRILGNDRRLLANWILHSELLREVRFPYLDRDFLEFLYAIPREQIVRVCQRRSLMNRALIGIVPDELLNRRRKAFVPQEPREQGAKKETCAEWPRLMESGERILSSSMGIVEPNRFWETLQKARRNEDVPIDSLKRTLMLESWLHHLTTKQVLRKPSELRGSRRQVTVRETSLLRGTPRSPDVFPSPNV